MTNNTISKLLLTTLMVLLFAQLRANGYVYPVATGASWATEVFEKAEKEQQEANKKHPSPTGDFHFAELFNKYFTNYQCFQLYEDSIFMDAPQEKWVGMFERRSLRYSEIYAENNKLLKSLEDYFGGADVPDAAYDSLYYWTRHLYHENMGDLFVIEQLVDCILTPHYESNYDYEHLELCYSLAGLVHYQFSRMGEADASAKSLDNFRKAVDLRTHFAHFDDPLNRYYLISSFVNLCVLHTEAGNLKLDEAIVIHKQMHELFQQIEGRQLFEADSQLNSLAEWALQVFSLRSIMTYICQGLDDPKLLNELYAAYVETKASLGGDLANLKFRYYAKIEYDDPIIEAFMNHIEWDEAYYRFYQLLIHDPELSTPQNVKAYRMNYMNNLFTSHIYLIEQTGMGFIEKSVAAKNMFMHICEVMKHFEHFQFPFEKGEIICNIATHPDMLKYLSTDEKRYMLNLLTVLNQPSCYVHVTMVARLTDLLTEALVEKRPEYFRNIPHLSTPDSVNIHKDELVKYVHQSALYHDLGMISIPTIANNRYRILTPHEIAIMELHTEKAEPYFAIDEDFNRYGVIVMGHHKWYDGSGYPASFNNTNRILFPIINIVSLCNFIDNATEDAIQQHHAATTFDEVMEQLKAGKGTQFDPVLVDLICNTPTLYEALKKKAFTSRAHHYYVMYRAFVDNKLPVNFVAPEQFDPTLDEDDEEYF